MANPLSSLFSGLSRRAEARRKPRYEPYLVERERVVFAIRRHWAILIRPTLYLFAAFALTLGLVVVLPAGLVLVAEVAVWACLALAAYLAWQVAQWRREFLVTTDKRLLLVSGLIETTVSTMPLAKVTDLSYVRTVPGHLLGYGTFVLESAGQNQAMHKINWIPDPDHTYRLVVADMFGIPGHEPDAPHREPGDHPGAEHHGDDRLGDDHLGDDPLGNHRGHSRTYEWPEQAQRRPVEGEVPEGHSRAIPVRLPEGDDDSITLFRSADLAAQRREDDTGPVSYYDSPDRPQGSFEPEDHRARCSRAR